MCKITFETCNDILSDMIKFTEAQICMEEISGLRLSEMKTKATENC